LKNISENNADTLIEEFNQLNLKHYIPEVAQNIAKSKMNARDQHITVHLCALMHQRYETFAEELIPAIEKMYRLAAISEFNKKRNILRHLTELFFKGLFTEYKRCFKCLNELIQIDFDESPEEFQHAMMVLSDYFKTYGEQVFQIVSRESRESIEEGFEVTIERHQFLTYGQRRRITEFLVKNYFEIKCIPAVDQKLQELKLA